MEKREVGTRPHRVPNVYGWISGGGFLAKGVRFASKTRIHYLNSSLKKALLVDKSFGVSHEMFYMERRSHILCGEWLLLTASDFGSEQCRNLP